MIAFVRHFRSPLIAVVALVFSAAIVFADQPADPGSQGRANAASHGQAAGAAESSDAPEASEASEGSEAPDSSESSDHCNVDLTQDPSVLAGLNHGSVVCTAAHMPTPSGYANHGAWVSHWARMNKGADASAKGKAHQPR